MYNFNVEKNTIKALNNLSESYPYATSLLVYSFIERILKLYIYNHRKDNSKIQYSIKVYYYDKIDKKRKQDYFNNLINLQYKSFIKNVLNQNTLEKCEKLVNIMDRKYSDPRNDIMHSNSFIIKNGYLEDLKRNQMHIEYKNTAFIHLFEAFDKYVDKFKIKIVDNKILIVE